MDKLTDKIYVNSDVFCNGDCMDKLTDERYVNSDIFCDGDFIQKGNDRNRLQKNVSQDVHVPMDGGNCSDKLVNGTYVNDDVLCNVCHVRNNNDWKRLKNDLSQDTYVPIEVGYNFMNRSANGTYENSDTFCDKYLLQKDKDYEGLQRNLSKDVYVSMVPLDGSANGNSIKNPTQMLPPLVSTESKKPIDYITIENNIYQEEIVKKMKNYSRKDENKAEIEKSTNKKQLRSLSTGFKKIPSLRSDPKDAKKRYSEIYDVPSSPRPRLPTKTQRNKESVFRSRSNACVSQNKRTYLKETKSADV